MTPLFPARRAAEEFEQALGGTAPTAVQGRYADLLETVEVLRAQPEVLPRQEFVDDLRSRLMTAAETELDADPAVVRRLQPTRPTTRRRRLGTVAASLVIVGGSAGMAAAASGALPGEPLYPIKRGLEEAGVAVRLGEANKGEALLDQAATRLREVRELQAQGSPDTDQVARTLAAFQDAADDGSQKLFASYEDGGETEDITTVRDFTAEEMTEVAALARSAAPELDALLVDAADTLADIDQQARALCGSCGDDAPLQPPTALASGAGAATVDNLLARPVAQARTDLAAVEAARAAQLQRLQAAAEETAGEIPRLDPADSLPASASLPQSRDGSVSILLTRDQRLPSLTEGAAVRDLVTGVVGPVQGTIGKPVTKVADDVTSPETPLDDLDSTVGGVTDGVEDTTDKLVP
jgi:hypothetical protein